MVRRFHRSIYDELDELKASMDYLFQFAFEPMDNPLLPQEETPGIVCLSLHTLNAEVLEDDDEVIVTLDIIPGIERTKISVNLVNPQTLKITCDRQGVRVKEDDRYIMQEQRSFSLHHEIPLPGPVTQEGATSTLKNGVLDLHLKKAQPVQT
jgi:HSP20 family molecular chaperone IbpA